MINHAGHDHPHTKAARAECRRQREFELADRVALGTYYWVSKARSEGYSNRIHRITFDEIAQEMGIKDYDHRLAVRLLLGKVKSLGLEEMLGDDMLPQSKRYRA